MVPLTPSSRFALAITGLVAFAATTRANEPGWIDLSSGEQALDGWRKPLGDWRVAGNAMMDPKNSRLLVAHPGHDILVNGRSGHTHDLLSKQGFGDVEVHLQFLIPKGSNSGVKLQGLYEIQIFDSWGIKKPTASDCGGIYPRAEMEPVYHHIDKGVPPRINACRPPGEWQTLEIVFRAPRFDAAGKKTANARFIKVVLNGQTVHDDVDVKTPTGHVWRTKEVPVGPLLLQADHGPVAFRNIRVRPLDDKK
jgi:hypothetical protein